MPTAQRFFLSLCLALGFALPAPAYELVTLDGRVREAESVQFAGEACIVTQGERAERLRAREVDYYETFKRNAASGQGNVIVFKTGAYFRFETIEMERGRVKLGLGEQGTVTVPEQVVDFEQSVQEAATVRLPRETGRVDVARARSSAPAGSARAGGDDPVAVESGGVRGRSAARRGGARLPGSGTRSRSEALRSSPGGLRPQSLTPDSEEESFDTEADEDEESGDSGSPPAPSSSTRDRDGMNDAEEVRRQAEEAGEASGNLSVVVSSQDALDVAAVQFRLRYPANCSPAGAQPIGAFANSTMSQPNGSVGGRPLMAMAIVYSADDTTSLPGEIARADFVWTGSEPTPGEFVIVSASATDTQGNALRGFRAEATLLR